MSLREKSKQENRQKILKAAKSLLRKGGISTLSMRELANKAQVSSRTPYNLFGSKTDILIALMDQPIHDLTGEISELSADSTVLLTFELFDKIYEKYLPEEPYYREIYWGIMSSEHKESRSLALHTVKTFVAPMLANAIERGELDKKLNQKAFTSHFVIAQAAIVGMWAASQVTADELLIQLKYSICVLYLSASTKKSKPELIKQLALVTEDLAAYTKQSS